MLIFDHGPGGRVACFNSARTLIVANRPEEVRPALMRAEEARRDGAWVAGWIGYEAGLALEPRLVRLTRPESVPLLVLGLYDPPARPAPQAPPVAVRIAPLRPLISREAYGAAFRQIQDYITAGDCYQVNLTFPLETRLIEGRPCDLYAALAALQPVGFGAFADMGTGPAIVSRSPELFFRLSAEGGIEARPMKGTAPRVADPMQDAALAAALGASVKNRAENLMIVDLLRNDLSRLAKVGSVRVPELFAVESFATVHQMTSRITAQLAVPPTLVTLMEALFPCGSITGAPKIRAMEIIHEIEPHQRGVYCGAIGWMAPDGSAAFSVAIRTLVVQGDRVVLNVGGGIVRDSTAESEWEEALWKARYVEPLMMPTCG